MYYIKGWDDVPALSEGQKWELNLGGEGLEDDPRSECLATYSVERNTDWVHHMVIDDRPLNRN